MGSIEIVDERLAVAKGRIQALAIVAAVIAVLSFVSSILTIWDFVSCHRAPYERSRARAMRTTSVAIDAVLFTEPNHGFLGIWRLAGDLRSSQREASRTCDGSQTSNQAIRSDGVHEPCYCDQVALGINIAPR